jgi:hypothetical protein
MASVREREHVTRMVIAGSAGVQGLEKTGVGTLSKLLFHRASPLLRSVGFQSERTDITQRFPSMVTTLAMNILQINLRAHHCE